MSGEKAGGGTGLRTVGGLVLRYGLVLVIVWFGLFKFTEAEAMGIKPLLENSPLLSWLYGVTDVNGASRVIGSAELAIAALLAIGPIAPRLSILGSAGALGMFVTTLSFLFTTPGMFAKVEWLVVPAGPAGFILKDLLLLGAALVTAADALDATARRRSA